MKRNPSDDPRLPQVCVGSPGRFHTFDLARQLDALGSLRRLYTAYPIWKVDVPHSKVQTFPWLMGLFMRFGWRLPKNIQDLFNRLVIGTFDTWMSSRVESCDVFHCLSSFGVESHQQAKSRFGALTICDRGSSHIRYQDDVLREEYERWNVPYTSIDSNVVDREEFEYEFCDGIVVPSTFAYRTFAERNIPRSKLYKVPFGVDLQMFRPSVKHDSKFRIIYAGTLSLRKGIGYLLQAVASLKIPDLEVWLIGNVLPEVKDILATYRDSYRYFAGVPRSQLSELYSQGSVFVIASVEEGLALVQPQAMACGLPVIATKNTGAEDLFDDGVEGFIVPIRDPAAIREKILYLYENPEIRRRMGTAATNRVLANRGWEQYGQHMMSVYSARTIAQAARKTV